ncbi:MAG: hypothetical protein JWM99_2489 [Verrucomicrobiales bacterium]|nr:hypothetical protein [Verrucomicrobiales bacterium]
MRKIPCRWSHHAGDSGGKNQDACRTFRIQNFVFKLTSDQYLSDAWRYAHGTEEMQVYHNELSLRICALHRERWPGEITGAGFL